MSEKTGEKLENVVWGKPGYQSDKKTTLREPDILNAALTIFFFPTKWAQSSAVTISALSTECIIFAGSYFLYSVSEKKEVVKEVSCKK